jgi:hypothetical protein
VRRRFSSRRNTFTFDLLESLLGGEFVFDGLAPFGVDRPALQRQFGVVLAQQHGAMNLLPQEGALVGEVIFAMAGVAQLQFGAALGNLPAHGEAQTPEIESLKAAAGRDRGPKEDCNL